MPRVLGFLGLSPTAEALYLAVTSLEGAAPPAEVRAMVPAATDEDLTRLLELGLLTRRSGLLTAVRPDLALHALARQEQDQADGHASRAGQLRAAVGELDRLAATSTGPGGAGAAGPVELITRPDRLRSASAQVCAAATRMLRRVELGMPSSADRAFDGVRRSVQVRTLLSLQALSEPGVIDTVQQRQLRGEELRMLPSLPAGLVLADDDFGLLRASEAPDLWGMVIRPSPFMPILDALFSLLWERGIPFGSNESDLGRWRIGDEEAEMLRLLMMGLKDQQIARHLGIGRRTVVRRIGSLNRALDAETRFQAGLQAGRRQLL